MPTAPKPLVNRPLAPTTIDARTTPVKPQSRERVHYRKIQLTAQQITKNNTVDVEQLVRVLNLIQDAAADGSFAARCAPDVIAVTVEHVTMNTAQPTVIRHGLGYAYTDWTCERAYPGSQPFAAVEVTSNPPNGGQDPTQFLVLNSSANGNYDMKVW